MPQPSQQALLEKIRQQITTHGPMPFQDFMEQVLYAPGLGYYVAGEQVFGEGGDFITAPEISPIFGHCLANALTESKWLKQQAILEFGAGNGLLAAAVLRRLTELDMLPETYQILEVSPGLKARQQQTLTEQMPELVSRVRWLDTLPTDFTGIVLANEVLDAMPATTLQVANGQVMERMVGLADDKLTWQLKPPRPETLRHLQQMSLSPPLADYPNGYQTEINLFHTPWLRSLQQSMQHGTVFLIDYGYLQEEYYHPQRGTGSLQCYHQHQVHDDPFLHLGEQDITCHVDFTHLLEHAEQLGFKVNYLQSQANFLIEHGLADAFSSLHQEASLAQQQLLSRAVQKLTDPQQMGETFNVAVLEV